MVYCDVVLVVDFDYVLVLLMKVELNYVLFESYLCMGEDLVEYVFEVKCFVEWVFEFVFDFNDVWYFMVCVDNCMICYCIEVG